MHTCNLLISAYLNAEHDKTDLQQPYNLQASNLSVLWVEAGEITGRYIKQFDKDQLQLFSWHGTRDLFLFELWMSKSYEQGHKL